MSLSGITRPRRVIAVVSIALLTAIGAAARPAHAQDTQLLGGDAGQSVRAKVQRLVAQREGEQVYALLGDVRVVVGDALVLADGAVLWVDPKKKGVAAFRALYAEGAVRLAALGASFEADRVVWDIAAGEARFENAFFSLSPRNVAAAIEEERRRAMLFAFGTRGVEPYDPAGGGATIEGGASPSAPREPPILGRADEARLGGLEMKKKRILIGRVEATGAVVSIAPLHVRMESVVVEPDEDAARDDAAAPIPPGDDAGAGAPSETAGTSPAFEGGSDGARRISAPPARGSGARWIRPGAIRLELDTGLFEEPIGIPWPLRFAWNTAWAPYIPRVRVGQSGEFGAFILTDWPVPLPTIGSPTGGPLRSEVNFEVDYYGERGPGGGVDLELQADDWQTLIDTYYVHDDGEDDDGIDAPNDDRSRAYFLHRHRLPLGIQLDAEVQYLSDAGFLNEFFEREAKEEKPPETYLHGRWADGDHGIQLTGRWRLNRFDEDIVGGGVYVEELPKLVYQLQPRPLFTEPLAGGTFYFRSRAELANFRRRERIGRVDFDDRSVRADLLGQATYQNHLGPLRLTGDLGGRYTFYERRAVPEDSIPRFQQIGNVAIFNGTDRGFFVDSLSRWIGFGTIALSTDAWRAFRVESETLDWTGLRHVFTPSIGYTHFYKVDQDPGDLLQFDEIDAFRETEFFFLNLRNRLQTRRLDGVLDVVDLELEARFFPHPGDEFERRKLDVIAGDLRVRPARWLTGRWKADYDPEGGGFERSDAIIGVGIGDRAWVRLFHNYSDGDGAIAGTNAVGFDLVVGLTDRWSLRLREQYDFEEDDFIKHELTIRRLIDSFVLDLNFSIDGGENDDFSFSVSILPRWLLGRGDAFEGDARTRDLAY